MIFIWNSEGFRGFFRGITPSLIQIAPFTGWSLERSKILLDFRIYDFPNFNLE